MQRKDLIEEAMVKFSNADRFAVEYFVRNCGKDAMCINTNLDLFAELEEWNSDTVNAIAYILDDIIG